MWLRREKENSAEIEEMPALRAVYNQRNLSLTYIEYPFLLADEEQTIVLPASKRATIALSSLAHILPPLSAEEFDRFRSNLLRKLDWGRDPEFSWRSLLPTFESSALGGGNSLDSQRTQYESLRSNLQKTLSRDEYEDLMRHIDEYIEGLLAERFLKKEKEAASVANEMSPAMAVHVANVVQQNLESFNYQLGSAEVDLVAEQVKQVLLANYPHVFKPVSAGNSEAFVVSKETVAEIQQLIKQQIDGINFALNDHQLENIVVKVLSSEKLVELMDSRILLNTKESMSRYETQAALIENLKNEIKEIKIHFTEKLAASGSMLENNLNLMRQNHVSLLDKVESYRIENDEKYLKLLADIDERLASVQREQFAGLNEIIKKNIVAILGFNVAENFTDEDIKTWISNLFVAKDYLETRLQQYQVGVNALIQKELERSAATLMKEVSDKIQKEVLVMIQSHKNELNIDAQAGKTTSSGSGSLSEGDVRRIVRDALRIYDADKTGLVDYALESAGGQILSTRCTENYQTQSAQISIFGIPLWYPTNTPRTVISPTMQPGQCWAFTGFPGYLVIQLNSDVVVTGFSLEHISKLLAPNGQIDSAPQNFSVWGLATENDAEPVLLGNYVYQDNNVALQYFPVDNPTRPELQGRTFRIVELRIESNHGNVHYTCLYRFRVHGERV